MKQVLLILLIINSTFAQTPKDSLLKQLSIAKADSSKLKILNQVFRQTLFVNPNEALGYAEKYLKTAQKTNQKAEIARGFNFIGMSQATLGNADKAIPYYLEALKRYQVLKDSLYIGIEMNNIAAAHQARDEAKETILYFENALEIFKKIKNEQWIGNVSNNLATQYTKQNQHEKAIKTAEYAIKIFQKTSDKAAEATALSTAGAAYLSLEKYAKALEMFNQSNRLVSLKEDALLFSINNTNIGLVQLKLKHYDQAEKHLLQSLNIQEELQSLTHIHNTLKNIHELYAQWGKPDKAYLYLKKFQTVNDSLYNQEKDEKLASIIKKYELDQKEQQIKLLNNQNRLKDLEINDSKQKQQLFIIGLIGLLGIIGLGLYLYKVRQKSNLELAQKNEVITKTLGEKEFLMKEIHHRVKNNLQVISSLLSLQSQHLKDPEAIKSIKESRDRVKSMALIHQNLYEEDRQLYLEINEYITKLAQSLFQSYNIEPDRILLQTNINKMVLDVDTVTSLGLIINELVTNSLKYAFPGNRSGSLIVNVNKEQNYLVLQVKDNGVGVPEDFDLSKLKSFGYQIIRSFSAKMKAELNIYNNEGTNFVMKIPLNRIMEKDFE
ncbi:histidine kinase dimerization/phosphoacceptor domain -containing protein [Emticicia sp. W12TSBA100-4]|uniref:tetratricopeptide repeat-containing sensor histidine kinase n=1 Tax=Emticicia sp. W12TSBA100-4 TaxID=3160965 RepID=UPI0033057118